MPSQTANLKIPYPLGSDPVADGDNQIRLLAERVDARLPWGCLALSSWTIAQGPVGQTPVAMASLSNVVIAANRRIRVSAYVCLVGNTSAGQQGVLILREQTTDLQQAETMLGPQGFGVGGNISLVLTPSAGSHNYALFAQAQAGQINVHANANRPGHLMVEDLGPVSLA